MTPEEARAVAAVALQALRCSCHYSWVKPGWKTIEGAHAMKLFMPPPAALEVDRNLARPLPEEHQAFIEEFERLRAEGKDT